MQKSAKPSPNTKLLARIGKKVSSRLEANPLVQKVGVEKAQIYYSENFLPPDDCSMLMDIIDREAIPSTLYKGTELEGYRTSSSCNFDRTDEDIQRISQRVADLLGLDVDHGETIQGQRYQIGQQYKQHQDYFHPSTAYWDDEMAGAGQRSWTAMVYLNQPAQGGATNFPTFHMSVQPRTGMLLAWNNMKPDGTPNPNTLHIGSPVILGTKYVFTNWFRERRWA
jgi:prolyl 4-hydroxylase